MKAAADIVVVRKGMAMLRASRWLLFAALLVGGCVAAPGNSAAQSVASSSVAVQPSAQPPATGGPLSDVQFARADSGLAVIAKEGLFRVTNAHLQEVSRPAPPSWITWTLAVNGQTEVMAFLVDAGDRTSPAKVEVEVSADAGASWAAPKTVSIPTTAGIYSVSAGVVENHIVILADETSSSNSSVASIAESSDSGGSWTTEAAPAGGTVGAAGGLFWLTGGPQGDQIFWSRDGLTWNQARIPVTSPIWSASSASTVDGIGVVIATTSHESGPSQVVFWASSDQGASWVALKKQSGPQTENAINIPTSVASTGQWIVVLPDGSRIYSGSFKSTAADRIISPNGLRGTVTAVILGSNDQALAQSATSQCPGGKQSCVSSSFVSLTTDGGQTWTEVH